MKGKLAKLETANEAAPDVGGDADDILAGLARPVKRLSPKYLYDARGSALFDRICGLPEYYPTRTELAILRAHAEEIAALAGPRVSVIEFGSGSSVKVRLLLEHLDAPVAYVPVDISPRYLFEMTEELAADYPHVHIRPVFADFTQPFELPIHPVRPERNLIFFPGSTIGNFSRAEAGRLLELMRSEAKPGGALLIGVDLKKDPAILEAAYNDRQGVTAEFNLNVLRRLNRELGANFDFDRFRHSAVYDDDQGRVEMRLVSTDAQVVRIGGTRLTFKAGEHIVTEHSHKYSVPEFTALAERAGFVPRKVWTDQNRLFSVHFLAVEATAR